MKRTRASVLALLLVVSMVAMPLSAAGAVGTSPMTDHTDSVTGQSVPMSVTAQEDDDRPDDPTTTDTIGYVEGYWYDDDLPVDDRDDAVLEDDELDAVVYRSMARVEVIRERTFDREVDVDVRTREAVREETIADFEDVTEAERLHQNVRFEALFMVDRETDAVDEFAALYSDAVGGYYDPETEEIVVVSDSPETPELDEVILGHELLHALQDQYFDLESYERATRDQATAEEGLIEGDAVTVEREYAQRCEGEWDCVLPSGTPQQPPELNWGIYFTIFQPYDDGPAYVEYLYEQGGWDAVDAAFDEPPASASDVMYPEEDREPAEIEIEDRSSDRWERVEIEDGPDYASFGEGAMATMLAAGAFDDTGQSVVSTEEFLSFDFGGGIDEIHYSQPYTDGWNGDRLVTYTTDEATVDESGYVWETEWLDDGEAEQFVDGYLQLLEVNGGEPVDDRQDTVVIDDEDGFPGAYYVDHDDTTVTIVRAPSVDELEEIREGAAPDGEDTLEAGVSWQGQGESDEAGDEETDTDGEDDADASADDTDDTDTDTDELPGFGIGGALLAVLVGTLALALRRG
ncbi:Hvo_1808 family surface protein [Natronoglomus mannanivorans]|uniref:Hvo_1808 family surface protein n=1 Tax=Natronoglomus mannanivorans TaxID=2979990 RepID=A0AAP2YWZ9_9EURY|nr:Hvo_1808 family surface protein [Halobacteria archaeon AArc-xg1-1]